jgi:DNA-binding response OmpR family regulator
VIRVHVIEDDPGLLDDVIFGLRHEGFEVSGASDGSDGSDLAERLEAQSVDVLVLDLTLPGEDGLHIASRLRKTHPNLGVVMLTGRISVADRVIGLESGGDIYLCKPVERRELVAAIRAVSRRVVMLPPKKATWILVHEGMQLLGQDGIEITLTRQEFQLLRVFSNAYGGEASRKRLIEGLDKNYLDYDERRLETLVSRLRRKIAETTGSKEVIRSLRTEGYLFTEPLQER